MSTNRVRQPSLFKTKKMNPTGGRGQGLGKAHPLNTPGHQQPHGLLMKGFEPSFSHLKLMVALSQIQDHSGAYPSLRSPASSKICFSTTHTHTHKPGRQPLQL